jgi:hypothetical protein
MSLDLVIKGFRTLIGKHDRDGLSDQKSVTSFDQYTSSDDDAIDEHTSSDDDASDEDSEGLYAADEVSLEWPDAAFAQEHLSADHVSDEHSDAGPSKEDLAATHVKSQIDLPVDQEKLQKGLLDSLRSSLLPRLRNQVTSLSLYH